LIALFDEFFSAHLMKLKTVTASHGIYWAKQGLLTFFKHPIAFATLFATFILMLLISALIPVLSQFLMLSIFPMVTLAFMLASNIVKADGTPTLQVFAHLFRVEKKLLQTLLWLGAIYALTNLAAMYLSDLLDGGELKTFMQMTPNKEATPDVLATKMSSSGLLWSLLLRVGLSGLLSVPFWHAPALIYWDKQGCAQALFSSTLACWRNRGAFTVYGLTFFAITVLISLASSLVLTLIGQPQMFLAAAAPISLLIITVFYVSLYFTFIGCFEPSEKKSDASGQELDV
jgi:hypothetical protein